MSNVFSLIAKYLLFCGYRRSPPSSPSAYLAAQISRKARSSLTNSHPHAFLPPLPPRKHVGHHLHDAVVRVVQAVDAEGGFQQSVADTMLFT